MNERTFTKYIYYILLLILQNSDKYLQIVITN